MVVELLASRQSLIRWYEVVVQDTKIGPFTILSTDDSQIILYFLKYHRILKFYPINFHCHIRTPKSVHNRMNSEVI